MMPEEEEEEKVVGGWFRDSALQRKERIFERRWIVRRKIRGNIWKNKEIPKN